METRKSKRISFAVVSFLLILGVSKGTVGQTTYQAQFKINGAVVELPIAADIRDELEIGLFSSSGERVVVSEVEFKAFFSRTPMFIDKDGQEQRRWKRIGPESHTLTFDGQGPSETSLFDVKTYFSPPDQAYLRKFQIKILKASIVKVDGTKIPLSNTQFRFNRIYKLMVRQ